MSWKWIIIILVVLLGLFTFRTGFTSEDVSHRTGRQHSHNRWHGGGGGYYNQPYHYRYNRPYYNYNRHPYYYNQPYHWRNKPYNHPNRGGFYWRFRVR